jgi:predicted DNA binding protein
MIMRKMILDIKLNIDYLKNFDFLLDKIESIELLELLKIDFEKRIKMAIAAFIMKEGYTIEDIKMPDIVEIFNVLQKNGDRYICLIKVKYFKSLSSLAKKFNIDIIWDAPSIFTKDKMIVSVTGNEENLKKISELFKKIGTVNKISFVKSQYNEQTILSCLTDKQREILIAAKKNGYYSYPRKINSQELSKKIGLSKPTVVQHLRKAEVRLVSNLLTGY